MKLSNELIIVIIIITDCFERANYKKAVEYEEDGKWRAWNNPQKFGKGTGKVGNWRTNRGHPNYSIVEIGQNTEKCPRDQRRIVVTRSQVKNHQPKLA